MDSSKHIFSAERRPELLTELKKREFDIVVVGGGITGAGIALDAATRGLSVALIEKSDFASGTSSRSTKLVHGGLRYLKNMEFKLVRDVGKERAIVYNNAPHLVVPERMVLPLVENGTYGKFATRIGLWLYDKLAGVKKSEKRIMLSKAQAIEMEPGLRKDNLLGAGYYSEYRTDDARLTLEVMKTASANGALCINYTECTELIKDAGKVIGLQAKDRFTGDTYAISAKRVVNACGPWVDEVRGKDGPVSGKRLHLTKGVHIVVPKDRLNIEQSVYFDVPGGRMIFAIPRFDRTYVGTTDTNYTGQLEEPGTTKQDVDYLLDSVNNMFPKAKLEEADILSSWSGLRPLIHEDGKSPSELSRKDELFVSDSNLITIAGGKLTGYRLMAKKVVDLICKQLEINQVCKTESIVLCGGEFKSPEYVDQYIQSVATRLKSEGIPEIVGGILVRIYGKQTDEILKRMRSYDQEKSIQAQAWFCLHFEQVSTLEDFYSRRTGMLNFYPNLIHHSIDIVANQFAEFLKWTDERKKAEMDHVKMLVASVTDFKA